MKNLNYFEFSFQLKFENYLQIYIIKNFLYLYECLQQQFHMKCNRH